MFEFVKKAKLKNGNALKTAKFVSKKPISKTVTAKLSNVIDLKLILLPSANGRAC